MSNIGMGVDGRRIFGAKTLRFLGGEPLLHPGIIEFIILAKELGIGRRVQVVTNGILLNRMGERF